MTSNIDLAPTFEEMAGANVPSTVDGHSLLGLLRDDPGAAHGWRNRIMVEHRYAPRQLAGPDTQSKRSGNPTELPGDSRPRLPLRPVCERPGRTERPLGVLPPTRQPVCERTGQRLPVPVACASA